MAANRIVLLLPLIVMIGLFVFGYMSIQQLDEVTNEQLQDHTEFDVTGNNDGNETTVNVRWQWDRLPEDGVAGDDFMIIQFYDEAENLLESGAIADVSLQLTHSDEVLYETSDIAYEAGGYVVSFQNEQSQHETLGSQGEWQLVVEHADQSPDHVQLTYWHTWNHHSVSKGELLEDSSSINNIDHWVVERFESIEQK
ncbi:hypothetical protein [Texcoconibacillus texcoconensis]|uniref:Uncharacterized protein n=1 Tax=Texcoconibacillus texcoconensis TaxID=1095777 RepID=A0A840QP48_9BACI|nr:hypothetical protein [Texcoconibacillus texcoconensis]MBB5173118.1 hypothetical protein [Texcoconibacillus texcoconensis]